mmetsp:Transcript_1072/g.1713  ORF Transcript_1072/g.1713 Transcript_1072/m.1713 type:complete len:364 (+) Transcript_1072:43-1134(+)|eukprot:CAMPEP_0201618636 /NCGR_PEP_ID=MMETSP0492-20130828/39539_1 /ASSEMBLY_ACC=CAM_ASM_000837 /TAXON_ID=420259 /ORGANISM="Thalassiosira gravida, Strain GMp14c1" /LENGTH=363 /DNA_ID=CAMNT_0048087289 /DNA_START=20 /DNA_END=1111 /DNA_ORIENTATION=+
MSSLPPRLSQDDIACLLERVDEETTTARELLKHADPITQAAGLSVHSSVLDATYNAGSSGTFAGRTASAVASAAGGGGDAAAELAPTVAATTTTAMSPMMDFRQEAALAMQARQNYNPLRGTLSAFPLVLSTTAGHSNTDHVVHQNPDGTVDKFSEYKRRMRRRLHQTQSEKGCSSDRWDLPRIPGGRRRRVKRDKDAPTAPPEPPASGYVIFVAQMTTKLRHDNPNRHHNQISAVRRISSMWNKLRERQREHYMILVKLARKEYEDRLMEYRATGQWTPLTCITRLDDNKNGAVCTLERVTHGPWVRIPYDKKNELERELESYDQVIFPPRPAGKEEAHERRIKESLEKRRRKIRAEGLKYY